MQTSVDKCPGVTYPGILKNPGTWYFLENHGINLRQLLLGIMALSFYLIAMLRQPFDKALEELDKKNW